MIFIALLVGAIVAAVLLCVSFSLPVWLVVPITIGAWVSLNVAYLLLLFLISLILKMIQPKRDSRFCRAVTVLTIRWLFRMLRIRVVFEGKEKLPQEPMVLISNHRSDFDPMAVLAVLSKRRIAYISKPSNLRIPIAGAFVSHCSFLPIDRENPRRALKTLRRGAECMRAQKVDIGIYPEGTRSRTGNVLPFKEGAFLMAKWAQAPVVLMTTDGTERIAGRAPWHSNTVTLRILEVIEKDTIEQMSLADLTAYAHTIVDTALTLSATKESL